MRVGSKLRVFTLLLTCCVCGGDEMAAAPTAKPVLHGRHWVAITGKPLGATAGAMMFQKGGNAVDAACAMLARDRTMWDTLGWGGETQALIYNPKTRKVIGVNALGVAPTGATPEFFKSKGMSLPARVRAARRRHARHARRAHVMLAECGKLSLADVLAPAIQMADGYPIEAQLADAIERQKARLKEWPYSKAVFLPHPGEAREAPQRRRDLPPARPRRHAAQAGRGRAAGARRPARRRKQAIYRRLRPLLQGRHRAGVRARLAGAGRPASRSRTWRAGRCTSKSR